MRVLIVYTAILAYAKAAPSHLLPLSPLAVRTFAYPGAISTVSSGDVQAAAIDAHVKYADLAQAAVDKAREISEQTVEDLNVKAYTNIAANQEKVNEAFWATEDKKWQTLDAIKTAEAQLDGALASSTPVLAKGAAVGPYVAAVAPYSAVASYSALPTISSGDIQAAAIDAQVKYADLAQASVDKARQISENVQAQWDSALASNAASLVKSAVGGPYVANVAPYSALSTVSSGDIQAAAIDAQVKYADQAQASIDKARLLSENAQAQWDSALASNAGSLVKSAVGGPYVANVASYSALPTVSSGDIQAAAIDAQVKYADQAQASIDKARLLSENAQAQWDSALASNAASLVKSAVGGPYVANVAPYSALPTVSSGDIQAAAIDAQVKYADQAQASIDKARQLSENAQIQLNGALASGASVWAKGASVGPYVAGVAPYSAVATYSAIPTVSSGDIQAAEIDARVKYADLAQAAVDKARQISDNAQTQLEGSLASNAVSLVKSVGPYVANVAPYSAIASYSAVAPITPVGYTGFVSPVVKSFSTQFQSQASKAEADYKAAEASVKAAEASVKSIESKKAEIEQSVKTAVASLESAKSEAGKAFATFHTSPFVARTVGRTSGYLTPNVYSSAAFGQPIAQPIAPVIGQTYLKTLC